MTASWTDEDERRIRALREATRDRSLTKAEGRELSELRHREIAEATPGFIRVEVGASDAEFAAWEVAEIFELAEAAQARDDGERGIIFRSAPSPLLRLAMLLRDEVVALPVPTGCTGAWDEFARLTHDGGTCPVHEDAAEAPA